MLVKLTRHTWLLLLVVLTACASPAVEFEGRYWLPRIRDFKVEITDDEIPGDLVETKVDFEEDLGLDNENFPQAQIRVFTGPNSWIRAEYTPIEFSGDDVLERTIEFGGETYVVGTRVLTDVEMHYFRLGWAWEFINVADGLFRAGTLLEAKGFYMDARLETPDLTGDEKIDESESIAFGVPTLGVVAGVSPMEQLDFFGEISGIYAGKYGSFFDAQAGVRFIPFENFIITGGYRMFVIDVEVDDDTADLTLDGFYLGGSIRF